MPPPGRDLRQRPHNEPALVRPGMRNPQLPLPGHGPAVGDQVEVEGAGRIGLGAAAAELRFDPVQLQ